MCHPLRLVLAYDYCTLRNLAEELRQQLAGETITSVRATDEVFQVGFRRQDHKLLQFTVAGGLYLADAGERERQTAHGHPWHYLLRARIVDVVQEGRDRILSIRLQRKDRAEHATYGRLILELLPNRCQAVLVSDESARVLGRWPGASVTARAQRVVEGSTYVGPPPQQRLSPAIDEAAEFVDRMGATRDKIRVEMIRNLAQIDAGTAREYLFRAGVNPEDRAADLGADQLGTLWSVLRAAYQETSTTSGYYWREEGVWCYSGLQPTRLGSRATSVASISRAIFECESRTSGSGSADARRRLKKRLTAKLRRAARTRVALERDLAEAADAENVARMGHSLMAQLDAVKPGQLEISLPDLFDGAGAEFTIGLDPRRTPAANAAGYLKRAAKYSRRLQMLPTRLARLQQAEDELKAQLRKIDEDPESEEVMALAQKHDMENSKKKNENEREVRPRRYRTSQGWSVWAGRNNRENDILTHRMAAQNDLWFHAHGYSGSHVILRLEGRREAPSRQTLNEAAGVAAYWSKGKSAKKVSVVFTEVKQVTRPKGGAPGLAHLRREKTLIVEPALLPLEEDAAQ